MVNDFSRMKSDTELPFPSNGFFVSGNHTKNRVNAEENFRMTPSRKEFNKRSDEGGQPYWCADMGVLE